MALNIPQNEASRLAALDSYSILDTSPEKSFDDLTEIAATICGVPISLVSFVAEQRQWFKAARGVGEVRETSRDLSFCAHTLGNKQTLVVPDAQLHPDFQNNALVTSDPKIRFYAGAPILEKNGHALGTVCVIDTEPRTLNAQQISALEALARQASALLEQRQAVAVQERLTREATQAFALASQQQQQLELALDSAGLAAWSYDVALAKVSGDARMASFFGVQESVGPAEVWLDAVVPEDRERVGNEFAASIAGAPYDTTYRVSSDGAVRWIHARAKTVRRPDGSAQMFGVCEDVTQEKLMASELSKSADRLAMAQSASGAVLFDWDLVSDRVTWGGNCFGRPPEELRTGADVYALMPLADREAMGPVVLAAIENGEEYQHEFRVYAPDGSLSWYTTYGKPLLDEAGKSIAVVGVNVDITDRKLSEQALLQSEKLAAVGRLASTISHEINNPLEAVTNLLYIVRGSPDLSNDDRAHLEVADRELARVSHITAQTLRFHRNALNPQPIEVRQLVSEVLELYQTRLTSSSIVVQVEDPAGISFNGFEGDLRQVLNNLVGNAFDSMRKGGRLRIRARYGSDWRTGEKGAVITIADTGSGIDAESRPRIFHAFFSTKGIGGTGLGLWISKRIASKHQGRIEFRSRTTEPHGTVFRLWLPCDVADSASEAWADEQSPSR